jgi:WD40 repeat protein
MDHYAHAHEHPHMSHMAQWVHSRSARRRHFLIALALAVVLLATGCTTSTSSYSATSPSSAIPSSSATSRPVAAFNVSEMTVWLANLFDIHSPRWINGVLAGEPCSIHPTHTFCPYDFATTPDGKILALVSLSGEIKVWDVVTRRLLFDEPGVADRSSVGSIGVWLSPDGHLVARAVYNSGFTKPMAIISFQIWDVASRQPLFHHGPTRSAPAAQICDVGLAPNELVLTFVALPTWDMFVHSPSGYVKAATYQNGQCDKSLIYVPGRAEWFLTFFGEGYTIWKPPARPVNTHVPCRHDSQLSAVNGNGDLYACATGGPTGPAYYGNSVLIWDVTKGIEIARLKDGRTMGNVNDAVFLNNGRSLAVLAQPPGPLNVTGPKNLLLYSLVPHPAEHRVIALPALSGGWSVSSIGGFAVAIGYGGVLNKPKQYCCLKAVMQPHFKRLIR